jgi:hypothetical protein
MLKPNFCGNNISIAGSDTLAYGGQAGLNGRGIPPIIWQAGSYKYAGSLSISANEATPLGIWFRPDGTRVYYVGSGSDIIRQHTLSRAWDITSAGAVTSSPVIASGSITGIAFDDINGTTVIAVDDVANTIYKYSLSTAWDITTLNATPVQTNSAIVTGFITPTSVWARSDGLQLIVGNTGATAGYRTLSMTVAWDLSTLAQTGAQTPSGIIGCQFANAGNRLITLTASGLSTWTTSAAHSITSPTALSTTSFYSTWSTLAGASDVYFRDNGQSYYIINSTDDRIYQFNLV